MTKRILIQFDPDSQPSSFDSVVAIDSGVDHLLRYGDVQVTSMTPLVHGAMFTRGGDDLRNTAIFIGGSDVAAAEDLFSTAQNAFFGPVRVSLMLDANGCNTTAAAAVVAASRHVNLAGAAAVVLGGTGPVGRRVAQLLVGDGADVRVTSRSIDRAQSVCDSILERLPDGKATAAAVGTPDQTARALADAQIIIACGAAGVELVDEQIDWPLRCFAGCDRSECRSTGGDWRRGDHGQSQGTGQRGGLRSDRCGRVENENAPTSD